MNKRSKTLGREVQRQKSSARKIFIVEDHPVYREGLRQLVNREADMAVCGEADDGAQALKAIPALTPDLVLVDLTLPGKSGLQLIKELRAVDQHIKLLVVSMHDQALYADRVLRAGGDGYIMKQEDPDEIINAIRDVLAGHIYVSDEVLVSAQPVSSGGSQPTKGGISQLTDSEVEILELLGRGQSNEEIASKLSFTVQSVGGHCTQIKRKLNLKSDNAVVRYAVCWIEAGAAS